MEGQGLNLQEGQDIFLYSTVFTLALEPTKRPVCSFAKGNWPVHEVDHPRKKEKEKKKKGKLLGLSARATAACQRT
jgi:hypothetical protein